MKLWFLWWWFVQNQNMLEHVWCKIIGIYVYQVSAFYWWLLNTGGDLWLPYLLTACPYTHCMVPWQPPFLSSVLTHKKFSIFLRKGQLLSETGGQMLPLVYYSLHLCKHHCEWAWNVCCDVWGLSQWIFRSFAKLWCGILWMRRICCMWKSQSTDVKCSSDVMLHKFNEQTGSIKDTLLFVWWVWEKP